MRALAAEPTGRVPPNPRFLLTIAFRLPSWWSAGLWLTFTPHADSLVGRAEVYVDNSPNGPTRAAVIGIPVACPVLSRVGQVGA